MKLTVLSQLPVRIEAHSKCLLLGKCSAFELYLELGIDML